MNALSNRLVARLACFLLGLFVLGCAAGETSSTGGGSYASTEVSAVIGADGGTLQLYQATLTIPAGALSSDTLIAVSVQQPYFVDIDGLSSLYEFSPAGLQFLLPAVLRLDLTQADPEAKLYRGEYLGSPPEEVSGAVMDGVVLQAQIDGFSYYLAGKPKVTGPVVDPGYGDTFVLKGVTYSTRPVILGDIKGFAYPLAEGAGVSDGKSNGGHVWYGDDNCVTFRSNGTGVIDKKGGRSTRLNDFPWIPLKLVPGTAAHTPILGLGGDEAPAGSAVLDPTYKRDVELTPFRWGVRLAEDGSVYKNYSGKHEYILIAPDSAEIVANGLWDPQTNMPSSDYGGNSFRKHTTEEPSNHHFCVFRETTNQNQNLGPICLETKVPNQGLWPSYTKKHCYAAGMLQGEYKAISDDGVVIQAGTFQDNRPVQTWTFSDPQTGKKRASGDYSADGIQQGEWEYSLLDKKEIATFKGGLKLSELGGYSAVLAGKYIRYDSQGKVELSGSYLDGEKTEWWYTFSDGYMTSAEEFDANKQLENGYTTCTKLKDGSEKCVKHTDSWRKTSRSYDWSKCSTTDNMTEYTYDFDNKILSKTCYDLYPPHDAPKAGPERKCGGVCKQ